VITADRVTIGLGVGTQPPVRRIALTARAARAARFDAVWTVDHFQGWFPQEMWNRDMSWMASPESTPHAYFDYQALIGYLAGRVGSMQIGVGVTEVVRRHPVLLAQTAMTWSHLTRSAPILGIGAGERENTVPYGLSFDRPVAQLADALPIVRRCFESRGPFDYNGEFYNLDKAMMDLEPAPGQDAADLDRRTWSPNAGSGRPLRRRLVPDGADDPDRYAESLTRIRNSAKSTGRDGRSSSRQCSYWLW
jgi:phthiodiolone/phenolphthiodiolone dimycocerosates ketoreductase